jgi:hypothetical protein
VWLHHKLKINKGFVALWPCHFYILEKYLDAKEELGIFKYFTVQK